MRSLIQRGLVAFAVTLLPSLTYAQANQCVIPEKLPSYERESPRAGEVRNLRATHYLLALSWSPQFCRSRGADPKQAMQCGGGAGQFGFILHGLWPDVAGRDDPAWCAPAKLLSPSLVRQHLCMTPSAQLLQHEWSKHGTCATDEPEKYFRAASLLFNALKFPDMIGLSRRRITASSLTAAIAGLNPGVQPNMIAVDTDRKGWLTGIKLCLNLSYKPQPCAREDISTPSERLVKIWRGGS